MNSKNGKRDQLEAAASHHERAGRFHHEATRHFEAGKDYAHAAHQAMLAQGHALHAIDQIHDVLKHNASLPLVVPSVTGSAGGGNGAAQHHAAAADLHERAAGHLRDAAKQFDLDRSAVAHQAQLALTLALRAVSHSNEAARQHVLVLREKELIGLG